MSMKFRVILSFSVFLICTMALVAVYYYGPKWDTAKVVVTVNAVSANTMIQPSDVVLRTISKSAVPSYAMQSVQDIVGKTALVDLPQGTMLYAEWIEKNPLLPAEGEVILPLPAVSLYAVNSSLRARDIVDIRFYKQKDQNAQRVEESELDPLTGEVKGNSSKADAKLSSLFIPDISVVSVRSSIGNLVQDTTEGKENDRKTSSDRIYSVEILVSNEVAEAIQEQLQAGYTIWLARTK